MADISKEEVKRVAELARLEVTDDECEHYREHLSEIISYFDKLNELDTEGVEPTTHVLDLKNVFSSDEPKHTITREEAFENAPDHEDGYFRVPSIMD